MPRRNLPPYVQVLRSQGEARGYRGWAMIGEKRMFGPTRQTADEAHRDAVKMRGNQDTPVWGGAFETRAEDWLTSLAVTASPDTIDFYRGKLRNLYKTIPKTMPVDRITPAVVREFVREAVEVRRLSARTIQHCRRTLNGFFRWMLRRGFLQTNPVPAVEWPKPKDTQPDVMTELELASALARITDPWAANLAMLKAFTGLRRAEMARLRTADVDVASRLLWVRGKSRAQSHPIAEDAATAAKAIVAAGREFVVPGNTEKSRREYVAETFRRWQRILQEPRWHPHALRHSVATIMLRKGVSPATVQRFLRHSSYAMTQRYVHMVEDDLRNATTRLHLLPKSQDREQG